MLKVTLIYYILFAILSAVGGILGYVRAGSLRSIIAGVVSGVILGVAAYLLKTHVNYGLFTGLIISVLLAGHFLPAYIQKGGFMPAGLMAFLSILSIVLTLLTWYKR